MVPWKARRGVLLERLRARRPETPPLRIAFAALAVTLGVTLLTACTSGVATDPASPASTSGPAATPMRGASATIPATVPPAETATATSPSSSATASPPSTPGAPVTTEAPTPAPAARLEDLPAAEGNLNAAWVGSGFALVGGGAGAPFSPAIVRLEAGAWSAADVPPDWRGATGQVTGIAETGGTFFAVGNELPDRRRGFIWFSVDDGATWELSLAVDDAALYDIAASGSTAVVVGAFLDAENNTTAAAWSSTDRGTWTAAEVEAANGQAMASVTATSGGFASVGNGATSGGAAVAAWRTTDGARWSAVAANLPSGQLPTGVVEDADRRLAISGASGASGDQHPFVARSVDGQTWERTVLSEAEGYASAIAMAEASLVVAGVEADRLTTWTEQDGTWEPRVIEPTGAAISDLAWDPLVGLLGAGALDGRQAAWLLQGPE